MPLYKSGLDMYKKYAAKFDPATISSRFTQVAEVAKDRAQEGLNMVATARDLIRPILDEYGVGGGLRATYLAFGLALLRHIIRQKGAVANRIASGLKSYFTTAYGLDPSICDEIIQVIAGWVMPY